ncbi:MAG TPA: T9SS type A sorting domain-containing protein [Bacteroidales bacterium]|nr:T9SS type A sorting domain-containing protein [Bacteroidales bacterium]
MKKSYALTILAAILIQANWILAQTPVLYYKFENNPTSTSTPNCGYPHAGNAMAVLTSVTLAGGGQFDTCLQGTGVGSAGINTGWNMDLGQKSWTISMWVSIPSPTTSASYFFGDAGISFRCFQGGVAGQNNLILRGNGITDVTVTGIGPAPTTVTFVYDSATSAIKAYKNGVLDNTVSQTPLNLGAGTGFKVGGYGSSVSLTGFMDEFRLYKRALSDAEVAAIWNLNSECGEANFGLSLPTPGVNTNYVSIPYVPAMNGLTNVTIEAWVKPGGLTTSNTVLNKGGGSFDYQLGINASGVPFFRVQSTIITSVGLTVNAGEWTHLAVTYDNTNVRFYKNGALISVVPCTTAIGTSTNEMRIGRGNADPGSGIIEELRLWSVVRTNAEINSNKCRKYPSEFSSSTGLNALWHFDGNLIDSVSGFNGTRTGTVGYDEFVFPAPLMTCTCPGTSSSLMDEACFSYTSPSGNYTWTSSGIYIDTISNMAGCDSIITFNLTINTVDTSVLQNGITLTANASGVTWQWVDCDNAFAIIPGADGQSFIPSSNGNFAVVITDGPCSDTSSCHSITTYGIADRDPDIVLAVFPNPGNGEFTISSGIVADEIRITDILDREILRFKPEKNIVKVDIGSHGKGFYMIRINYKDQQKIARIIVNR